MQHMQCSFNLRVLHAHRIDTGQAEQVRESSLKYQTRCVAAYPDGQGFAVASVEGRVAMEYYNKEHQVRQAHIIRAAAMPVYVHIQYINGTCIMHGCYRLVLILCW